MIEYKFSLELTKNGIQKSIHAKTGEEGARKLIITLTENGNIFSLSEKSIRVFFDDETYSDDVYVEDNRIIFVLPSGLTAESGIRLCEFKISQDNKVIYSPVVEVAVEGNVGSGTVSQKIGQTIQYQESIPTLGEMSDDIADDDSIAVYDNSEGKAMRVLWSKIRALFGSATQEKINSNAIKSLQDNMAYVDMDIETLKEMAHSHSNSTTLDKLGEDADGNLTYNGSGIGTRPTSSVTIPNGYFYLQLAPSMNQSYQLVDISETFRENLEIKTIRFLYNGEWIDIHELERIDGVPYILNMSKTYTFAGGEIALAVLTPIEIMNTMMLAIQDFAIESMEVVYYTDGGESDG